jgi:dihydroorotase
MDQITISRPFDAHVHFRDGELLKHIAPLTMRHFIGALVMPNLVPPITTFRQMSRYANSIYAIKPRDKYFYAIMTLYLTETLDLKREIDDAYINGEEIKAIKYYPKGATTNSESGITNPVLLWTPGNSVYDTLKLMAKKDIRLLLHGADVFSRAGFELDPYYQEEHFINYSLPKIREAHPYLKICLEHISTETGVNCIMDNTDIACTVTAHHALLDRRDVFRGGMRPHLHCLPQIQSEKHKEAIRELLKMNLPSVFLGSDSAPHLIKNKESACCPGGVFTAHIVLELYTEIFDEIGNLNGLEAFASVNGPKFYGINKSSLNITLKREEWTFRISTVDISKDMENDVYAVPFRLGEKMKWKIIE